MVRTLMDKRYYYGIRQEAAYVLTKVVPQIYPFPHSHFYLSLLPLVVCCIDNSARPNR